MTFMNSMFGGNSVCLKVNSTVTGDAKFNKRGLHTLASAKAYVKRECLKHDYLGDTDINVSTTLSDEETEKLHSWINSICSNQHTIWKKAMKK